MNDMQSLPFQPAVPCVTLKKFSELTGMPYNSVTDMADKGKLPIVQKEKGHARYVDLVVFAEEMRNMWVTNWG